jgi:hypothetical protein
MQKSVLTGLSLPVESEYQSVERAWIIDHAEELLEKSVPLRIFPAVFSNIHRLSPTTIPAGSRWRAIFQRNFVHNLALEHEETRLLEQLQKADIPCRTIKGVSMVKLLYPDLSWRTVADIDLLLPRSEVEAAYFALKEAGLRDAGEPWTGRGLRRMLGRPADAIGEISQLGRQGAIVELHWDWTGESFPEREPWRDHEAFLLYLCRHAGKHFWYSLRMVADIELYLRKFGGRVDWDRFWKMARGSGWARTCAASFELCATLYGRPAGHWKRSRGARSLSNHAARNLLGEPSAWWCRSENLSMLKVFTWRQRIGRCRRLLAPPPAHWNQPGSALSVWTARYRRLVLQVLARIVPSKNWRRRLDKAVDLSGPDWAVFLRAWLLLPVARMGLAWRRFDRIERWASRMAAGHPRGWEESRETVVRAAWLVDAAANHNFIPTVCLPRAVVLLRILSRLGVVASLKLGVQLDDGVLRAHAWVEWRGERLNDAGRTATGFAELERAGAARNG